VRACRGRARAGQLARLLLALCFAAPLLPWADVALAGDAVDGPPVTRSQAILTADAFARIHWRMTEANRTGRGCGNGFTSRYPTGRRIGMAYKWGGWDTVVDFERKLADGYGAGTGGGSDTYDTYPRECVTGISCTGLVSRAWHLDHKYTLNYQSPRVRRKIGQITHAVAGVDWTRGQIGDLRKGDVLLSDTHTAIFVYQTRDGRIMIVDARLAGVRFREAPRDWLARNGYQAIRYNNIVEVTDPPGTLTRPQPIDITGLPRTVRGNTRDVVSVAIDRYAAAPEVPQPGPEVVFSISLARAMTISFTLDDLKHEGIDHDLHLLRSLAIDPERRAQDCLASHDRTLIAALEAGTYFLVVDSGADQPGEFTLQLATR
jgi:hypothetical protein